MPCFQSSPVRARARVQAFTLIELLTVIAIIGILAAILIPVIGKVRSTARNSVCVSNLRQYSLGVQLFAGDNKNRLPGGSSSPKWYDLIKPYMGDARRQNEMRCPDFDRVLADYRDTTADSTTQYRGYFYNRNLQNMPMNVVANPNRTPVVWDASGLAGGNTAGSAYTGRHGSGNDPKYRHGNKLNLAMLGGNITNRAGRHSGSETVADTAAAPEAGGIDWSVNDAPFQWADSYSKNHWTSN